MGEQVVPHPADAADAELDKWIPIWGWNKTDKTLDKIFEKIECPPLPPITTDQFDAIQKLYSKWTTVGSDGIHPKIGKQISKAGKEALVKILGVTEKVEEWPGVVNILNAVPKESGGNRLLGLFSTRYRWWSRLRFLVVKNWEEGLPKNSPFWAGKGKPSTRAILEYLLQDELVWAEKIWGRIY